MKKLICVFALFAMLLTFAACGAGKPSIVGTWQGNDGEHTVVYVFRDDGTGTAAVGDAKAEFTYAIEDESLTVTLGGETDTASVKLTEDRLSITDEYGTTVLTRAD